MTEYFFQLSWKPRSETGDVDVLFLSLPGCCPGCIEDEVSSMYVFEYVSSLRYGALTLTKPPNTTNTKQAST